MHAHMSTRQASAHTHSNSYILGTLPDLNLNYLISIIWKSQSTSSYSNGKMLPRYKVTWKTKECFLEKELRHIEVQIEGGKIKDR